MRWLTWTSVLFDWLLTVPKSIECGTPLGCEWGLSNQLLLGKLDSSLRGVAQPG